MDRRRLLKIMGASVGYTMATPALLHLLSSCESKTGTGWKPIFLNTTQAFVVEQLSDIILPKGENIGALEVNTPQFIDLLLKNVVSKKEQNLFLRGGRIFQNKFQERFDKSVEKGTRKNFEDMLSHYFKKNISEQKEILEFIEKKEDKIDDNNQYLIYHFLIAIRKFTLLAYYTSKEIEPKIFNAPSFSYQPCNTL
ncbi:gluconate 2-dehydrogenase subunit 3 family protein [Flavivirga spongiicola]|uniref:Gluconate 2-dehydrogenase subunit 3 family protein n=1 Tax=Flavivirga spongiicola TaxID=421621 RepID=A0ABU7XN59_9FLAO|nr:gluconate 2-dehydrogenase subunit 3 family protein [Flavivirga sp. MEBiC05379]MDO5981849.1 gluconate 2-dehydrogenase subunit 3 family protein [Flavivirga sp. MEBiC05379]